MKKILVLLTILIVLPAISLAETQLQITSSTTPASIVPGNDGFVEITISNVGTSIAESVKAKVLSIDSPIRSTSTTIIESLGSIGIGESKSTVFKFSVPSNTPSGFYVMQIRISSCSGSVCKDNIQNAVITVQSPSSLKIESINPNELIIGENTIVNVVLKNVGGGDLNNIFLKWSSTNSDILPFGSDNEEFVSEIKTGEQTPVPLNIFVSQGVESDIYPIDIELSYDDASGSTQSMNTTVGMVVSGTVDFILNADTTNLPAGGSGILDVIISNRGTAGANFLTVKASSPHGDKEFYIGELEADDEDTVEIPQSGVIGAYDIDLTLTYKDKFNNEFSVEKTLQVNPAPAQFPIIAIIVIVIIAAGAWYWWKKKKK